MQIVKDQQLENELMLNPASSKLQSYMATEIFQGNNEVRIIHAGEEYRLRITKKGRLILTK